MQPKTSDILPKICQKLPTTLRVHYPTGRGLYELLANGRPALGAVLDRVAGGDLGAHVPPGGVPEEANDFIHSFMSFIHAQSIENFGTRKKRKEHMRKATDVETKIHDFIRAFISNHTLP